MQLLRNIPIKRKLTIITMLTSSVALLLACAAFLLYEQLTFRQTMARDFAILAEMFENDVAPGLTFNDSKSIEQTLQSLSAHPHILAAGVYNHDGNVVGRYQRSNLRSAFVFPPAQSTGSHFRNDRLDTFQEVMLAGEPIGTVYIASDLAEFAERLKRYAVIMILVLLASSLAAFGLSSSLRKIISEPISQLAKVAHTVATERNYSIRAVKRNEDELGSLIDGFNEMLSQIQQRDSALEAARGDLEKRVEERTHELAHSLSLLNATLDSTTDGILAIQFTGAVTFNTQFGEMWGLSAEALARANDSEMIALSAERVLEPETFIKRIAEIHAHPEVEAFDLINLKDGRSFERYIKPQRVDGKTVGLVVNFRDITERTRGEVALGNINRQLLDSSRQAGMAEVATSVLHNVGNVLNSVNVSCAVISEKVRKSRVSSVAKTAELLREQGADLATFFTSDPAGIKLPEFLGKLAIRLSGEQAAILGELQLLSQNIEHIKDIVAVQQSYANVGGLRETLPIVDIVEDAIRMNAAGIARHRVEIIRDYQEVPPASMEKHKVLQIIVNLIRNAKHALVDGGRSEKRLVVRIARSGTDRVCVSLTDNGIGIAPDNLTRIFAHGFTTKKNGHGFGLHSGVLAAQEMGGSLSVQSSGPGAGATFTLELPVSTNGHH